MRGRVGRSLGVYTYAKYARGRDAFYPCEVKVFPLAVKRQLKRWPEAGEREAQWYPLSEAASIVAEEGLREIILALEAMAAKPR